jgi:hypothetical protein
MKLYTADIIWRRGANVRELVAKLLVEPCPKCAAPTAKSKNPAGELDIVCSKACGWFFPVDTGPFPISGRRVD